MCNAHQVPVRIPCSEAVPAECIMIGIISSRAEDLTSTPDSQWGVLRLDLITPTISP